MKIAFSFLVQVLAQEFDMNEMGSRAEKMEGLLTEMVGALEID